MQQTQLSISCRIAEGFLSKEEALLPLSELVQLATDAGYSAICMRASQVGVHSNLEDQQHAAQIIHNSGIKISMLTGDFDIVYNNDRGSNCLQNITPYLDLAQLLGTTMLRVCIKEESDVPRTQRACDEAAERGMTLLHQCHIQSLFETVDQIVKSTESIDRPNFGLIFEAANLEECGQSYGADTIDRLAPWIQNVYLQNQRLDANGKVTLDTWCRGPVSFDIIEIPDTGGINFPSIFSALQAIDYAGPITVHQSAPEDGSSPLRSAMNTAEYLTGLIHN